MALLHSLPIPLGSPMTDFSLPDPFGKMLSTSDYADRKVLVIIFMCNHCPYIQAIQERLIALQESFDPEEAQLIGVNSNDYTEYPDDSPEAMKEIIARWGINFPYLIDEEQEVAKEYQAQCTPDIFVFDQDRKLAYHGRLDDNWKEPDAVTKEELKAAIKAVLNGQRPSDDQKPSMGCSIKWKSQL